MSDTCWLNMTFPRKDLPAFNKVLKDQIWDNGHETAFWDEDNGDDSLVDAIIYEANYGWYDEIQALAKAGLSFLVGHGAGGEYGPCAYACYQGDLAECSTDYDGNPVAVVNSDGTVTGVENCMKYHRLVERVRLLWMEKRCR